MRKIIIGCILLQVLTLEPIIGYSIFHTWLKIDDVALNWTAGVFFFTGFFQFISYGSIVVTGFKEVKINHAFSQFD